MGGLHCHDGQSIREDIAAMYGQFYLTKAQFDATYFPIF
jgi:hypothetical protein